MKPFARPPAQTLALMLCAVALLAGAPLRAQVEEELPYRWHLGGFKGVLARLIIPGTGEAVLRTTATATGGLRNELQITSSDSRQGEFWLYGSEVASAECTRLTRAWTEQLFRGRAKERRAEIDEAGVLDIPSCICRIRREPPAGETTTRIWSNGKVYPVRISSPVAGEAWLDGGPVATSTYTVSGVERADEKGWKGRLELVLALDEQRTPLEIAVIQPGLSVRLELVEEL